MFWSFQERKHFLCFTPSLYTNYNPHKQITTNNLSVASKSAVCFWDRVYSSEPDFDPDDFVFDKSIKRLKAAINNQYIKQTYISLCSVLILCLKGHSKNIQGEILAETR